MESEEISADLAILLNDPHQWPNFGNYRPLVQAKSEVRLLSIHFDQSKNIIYGHIQHASLEDDSIQYEALSYSWGPPVHQKMFLLDDEEVLIRSSLHAFLVSLCNQPGGQKLPVWVDAICIDQRDMAERNWQVAMMGTIYSKASQVLVWLGKSTTESEFVFLYLQHHRDQRVKESLHQPLLKSKAWEGLEDLARRPYWTRLWIVQEVLLAAHVTIWTGHSSATWPTFLYGLEELCEADKFESASYKHHPRSRDTSQEKSAPRSLLELMMKLRGSTTSDAQAVHSGTQNTINLATRISQFSAQKCENPHDRAYALRSLAVDGGEVTVDYSKPLIELCFDVVSSMWAHPSQAPSEGTPYRRKDMLEMAQHIISLFEIVPDGKFGRLLDMGPDISGVRTTSFPLSIAMNSKHDLCHSYQRMCDLTQMSSGVQSSSQHKNSEIPYEEIATLFSPRRSTDWPRDDDWVLNVGFVTSRWYSRGLGNVHFVFRPRVDGANPMQFVGVYVRNSLAEIGFADKSEWAALLAEDEAIQVIGMQSVDALGGHVLHVDISHLLLFLAASSTASNALYQELNARHRNRRWSNSAPGNTVLTPECVSCDVMGRCRHTARFQLRDICMAFITHPESISPQKTFSRELLKRILRRAGGHREWKLRLDLVQFRLLDQLVFHLGMLRLSTQRASCSCGDGPKSFFEDFWLKMGLSILRSLRDGVEEDLDGFTPGLSPDNDSASSAHVKMSIFFSPNIHGFKIWPHLEEIEATFQLGELSNKRSH